MTEQYVYAFGEGKADGNASMRDLLGGKGAGLAEMTNAGVPVPPGFTITTEVCRWYYAHGRTLPPQFEAQQAGALATLEKRFGKKLGDPANPLLVFFVRATESGPLDFVWEGDNGFVQRETRTLTVT